MPDDTDTSRRTVADPGPADAGNSATQGAPGSPARPAPKDGTKEGYGPAGALPPEAPIDKGSNPTG